MYLKKRFVLNLAELQKTNGFAAPHSPHRANWGPQKRKIFVLAWRFDMISQEKVKVTSFLEDKVLIFFNKRANLKRFTFKNPSKNVEVTQCLLDCLAKLLFFYLLYLLNKTNKLPLSMRKDRRTKEERKSLFKSP